jgi:ABC-type nitrate/sulfonate/bicarbonate transport system permease component
MQSARAVLEATVPFRRLSADGLEALARGCEVGEVAAGQTIYDATGPVEHLYVVRSGTVRLTWAQDGDGPGRGVGPYDLFGCHALHQAQAAAEDARAESSSSLLRVPGRVVLDVLACEQNGSAIAEALVEALSGSHPPPEDPPHEQVDPAVSAGGVERGGAAAIVSHFAAHGAAYLRSRRTYARLAGYTLFFGSWYLAVEVFALPRFAKLPGITQVVREWLSRDPVYGLSLYTPIYYEHIWASLRRIGIAFTLATSLGVPMGLLLGACRAFREYVFPVFELVRPIPILAWVPLAIIMCSGSETPVIFLTFLASFFATALNTLLGVKSVDRRYVLAARCLGASRWQTFWHVIVPGSMPFILTGLQISIGVGWFSLAAAEMVSGQFGLGYLINTSYTMVQYPTIVIGMLTLGFVGYTTSALVRFVGERLTAWRARELGLGKV